MQTDIMVQLMPIFPEILVSLGTVVLLLTGIFSGQHSYSIVMWLTIAVLVCAVIFLVFFPFDGEVFGGALILDAFGRFMKILLLAGVCVVLIMSTAFARAEKIDKFEMPVLMLLSTTGMMLMISAGNLLSLYLGLELQSLSLYVLAAINRDSLRSTEAGLKYFVLGALSSGVLLYGITLLYGYTGHLDFSGAADVLIGNKLQPFAVLGLVFLLAGLSFKISAVPFHMWTPDVYEGSPTLVTAFFASAPKVAAIALIVRVVISVFGSPLSVAADELLAWQQIIIFLAVASMIWGAFAGIGQRNIKRLMAYSSISHIGYALVGLSSGTVSGVQSVLVYMVMYVVMTLGCFAFILAMNRRNGYVEDIHDVSGLARNNPFMSVIMTMHLLSLASIPPFGGFLGKWLTFSAAVGAGLVPLAVVGMLASVIGAFYYLRLIKIMWFDEPAECFLAMTLELKLVLLVSGLVILFGLFLAVWLLPLAEMAAQSLF